jgi:hypothetical protein
MSLNVEIKLCTLSSSKGTSDTDDFVNSSFRIVDAPVDNVFDEPNDACLLLCRGENRSLIESEEGRELDFVER